MKVIDFPVLDVKLFRICSPHIKAMCKIAKFHFVQTSNLQNPDVNLLTQLILVYILKQTDYFFQSLPTDTR